MFAFQNIVFIGLAFVFSSCGSQVLQSSAVVSKESAAEKSYRLRFMQASNQFRVSEGKNALPAHDGLNQLARNHSAFQKINRGKFEVEGKNISHAGFSYRASLAQYKYQMINLGENVAAGKNVSPEGAVRLLASSPRHRTNMLNSWTHAGAGVVIADDGSVFVTQLFGAETAMRIGRDPARPRTW